MPSSKAIIILIGNNGALISHHQNNNVTSEFFSNNFNDNKEAVANFLSQYPKSPIYVILDTVEQTYKRKLFPNIRKSDIQKIAKRELIADNDGDTFKNFIILQKKSGNKKIKSNKNECLFVSASKSENINNWINFLSDLPNRLIGIYLSPVESFNVAKKIIQKNSENKKHGLNSENIFCFIVQTKVGGIKQVVFSSTGIVFTRVLNYNFSDPHYVEKYYQDIYSTFEYLKRMYLDLSYQEFEVINILPQKVIIELNSVPSKEIKISCLSTADIINSLNLHKISPQDGEFDLILNSLFIDTKKILKFTTPKISYNEKIILIRNLSQIFNFLLLGVVAIIISAFFIINNSIYSKIDEAEMIRLDALKKLSKIKKQSMSGNYQDFDKENNVEKIFDMGRVEESLGFLSHDFLTTYSKLSFMNNFSITFNSFEYKIINFNPRQKNPNAQKQLILSGKILNKSGDIENLFTEFDKFIIDTKNNLSNYEIKNNEVPRNIDFNQKYFDFPVELTIISKKENIEVESKNITPTEAQDPSQLELMNTPKNEDNKN